MNKNHLKKKIETAAKRAKKASREIALLNTETKNKALRKMAKALVSHQAYLIKENKKDLLYANKNKLSNALVDRLTLNEKRIKGMAQSLLEVVKIKDPVGEVIKSIKRPNGLHIKKVRTPIGVIGIIFESRPNVTSDCIGLCIKSGNAVFLKGGKEAAYSNKAIYQVILKALRSTKVPLKAIVLIDSTDRQAMHVLMGLNKYVDLIIPRGGESLIRFVAENASVPVIKHYKGVCHTYVSDKAKIDMARAICINAKVQRPGVCNAMETMLVHKNIARKFLPKVADDLIQAGVELRADTRAKSILKNRAKKASVKDWDEEYLDLILAILPTTTKRTSLRRSLIRRQRLSPADMSLPMIKLNFVSFG